jgi:Tol biopolymer transport system component
MRLPNRISHHRHRTNSADGSSRSVIFRDPEKNASAPAWSPKGDRIAFALGQFLPFRPPTQPAHLALVRPDGTDSQVLTSGSRNDGFPSWSPDGRRIVYRSTERLGADRVVKHLRILDVATRRDRALADGGHDDNFPAWSPDGDRIAFTSDRAGPFNLYVIRPDGTGLQRLTDAAGRDAHCCWSADGKWLFFSGDRGGHKDEPGLMASWVTPWTPSMRLGSSRPCRCRMVDSGSMLWMTRRTRSPSVTSMVGPGMLPL